MKANFTRRNESGEIRWLGPVAGSGGWEGRRGSGLTHSDLTYPAEGCVVPARLYLPEDPQDRHPGIVLCPGRKRDIEGLTFLSTRLAGRGYTVLATRYRDTVVNHDQIDVAAAVGYLRRQAQVDPCRIGLVGHSRGGLAALRTAAAGIEVRAVVALSAVTDLRHLLETAAAISPRRYAVLRELVDASEEALADTCDSLSALPVAAAIQVPVLLVHGDMDMLVPVEHSLRLYDALVAAGRDQVSLHLLPGIGHFFEQSYYGYQNERVADITGDWLQEVL